MAPMIRSLISIRGGVITAVVTAGLALRYFRRQALRYFRRQHRRPPRQPAVTTRSGAVRVAHEELPQECDVSLAYALPPPTEEQVKQVQIDLDQTLCDIIQYLRDLQPGRERRCVSAPRTHV